MCSHFMPFSFYPLPFVLLLVWAEKSPSPSSWHLLLRVLHALLISSLCIEKPSLQAKQPQLPQSLFIRDLTQPPDHLCSPPLDLFHDFVVLKSPELGTALQIWLHQDWVKGPDHLLWCATSALCAAQDTTAFLATRATAGSCATCCPPVPSLQSCFPADQPLTCTAGLLILFRTLKLPCVEPDLPKAISFHGCFCPHFCCAVQPDSLPNYIKVEAPACSWEPCYGEDVWIYPSCGLDCGPRAQELLSRNLPWITGKFVPGHGKCEKVQRFHFAWADAVQFR